jgi:hypothetical protein
LLALDEPYQTAIFLRYFEDLPPRAICRRTGANLATVKSRLQRGLVLLRARGSIASARRPRAVAHGALVHLRPAAVDRGGGPHCNDGSLALGNLRTKTLIAAGLLCAGGLFAFTLGQDPPPRCRPSWQGTVRHRRRRPPRTLPATRRNRPSARRQRTRRTPRCRGSTIRICSSSYVALVVDETGVPVEGHKLRLAPPGCTLNDAKAATGPDGRVTLSWRSRVPTGEVCARR